MAIMNDYIDFKTVCRICLGNEKQMISLFDHTPCGMLFSEMLQECTSVFVSHNDSISKNVCIECSKDIQNTYKFKLQCLSSDNCLKDYAENEQNDSKVSEPNVYFIFDNEPKEKTDDIDLNLCEVTEDNVSIDEVFIKTEDSQIELCDENDFSSHLNRTENDSFQCEECGIEFQLETDFIKHIRIEHKETKKGFVNTYTCNICHKVYSAEWGLKKHLVTHGQCKYCDQKFEDNTELLQHIEDHRKLGYTCGECGKKFKSFVRLRTHRQVNIYGKGINCCIKKT